jgi:hypothetical protein
VFYFLFQACSDKERLNEKASVLDLVRSPNMRKRSLNLLFNWYVDCILSHQASLLVMLLDFAVLSLANVLTKQTITYEPLGIFS